MHTHKHTYIHTQQWQYNCVFFLYSLSLSLHSHSTYTHMCIVCMYYSSHISPTHTHTHPHIYKSAFCPCFPVCVVSICQVICGVIFAPACPLPASFPPSVTIVMGICCSMDAIQTMYQVTLTFTVNNYPTLSLSLTPLIVLNWCSAVPNK